MSFLSFKLWKKYMSLSGSWIFFLSKWHKFLCGFCERQTREFLENEAEAA